MTQATITESTAQSSTLYAIFRKDVGERTEDTALQGKTYVNINDAKKAFNKLKQELSLSLQSTIEIRLISGDYIS